MFETVLLRRKSDADIAAHACSETSAFEELYRRHAESIYRFVRYRTNSNEDAEDITADIFIKAMAKIQQYNSEFAFSTWLFSIARNTVIDFWRTQKAPLNIEHIEQVADETMRHDEHLDARLRVEDLMSRVSENDRTLIVLRFEDGLSYAEVSTITGRSEASLRKAFSRLKKALAIDNEEL